MMCSVTQQPTHESIISMGSCTKTKITFERIRVIIIRDEWNYEHFAATDPSTR